MKNKFPLLLFAALVIVYVGFVMISPASTEQLERFHTSQLQLRLLNLTVVIPLALIWATALYGYLRFRKYVTLVTRSTEGGPLNTLADGLMILAFSLPATSAISACLTYIATQNPDFVPAIAIIKNYVALGLSFAAYVVIANGARGLAKTTKQTITFKWVPPLIIVLSVVYTWFIVARPFGGSADANIYYLPEWLIIFTLAIPYIFAWYQGILATYYLGVYKSRVRGHVYKEAFADLARGIGVVVAVSILIRFVTTLSSQLSRLDLTPLLGMVYFLVIFYAVGFALVARGSKKLTKIEEV